MASIELEVLPGAQVRGAVRWQSWVRAGVGLFDRQRVMQVAVLIVLVMAAGFRLSGQNWDEGRHLHPDERFLSTVTNDLQWPDTPEGYFDPNASSLSPYALPNMGLFVYGTLPVYLVKWVAVQLGVNNYDKITMLGRTMSALFDLAAVYLLFVIGRRLYGKKVGLLAAALLALSVLGIQLSHFYTVDTFANLFIIATMFFLVRTGEGGRWSDYALAGLAFGLGLASKLSAVTLAAPILAAVVRDFYLRTRREDLRSAIEHTAVRLVTLFALAFLTFRVIQPIAFSGPSFMDLSLNPQWLKDVVEQQKITGGDTDLPWVQQWTSRSMAFPLYNILFWGLGLPLGLAALAGLGLALYELGFKRKWEHLLPVTYIVVTFVYHASQFVKFMRYFYPIYPFLVLLAAYAVAWLWRRISAADLAEGEAAPTAEQQRIAAQNRRARVMYLLRPTALRVFAIAGAVAGLTLLYALAFSSIYGRPNPRIAASRWIDNNIPAGSTLANEHWDDWVPVGGVDGKTAYGASGAYKSVTMNNYDDDTPDKLKHMVANLSQADYVLLSSNRLYDSIPRLPVRYPLTTRYYQMLFSGQLGFKRIADFTSYPALLGIQIPDQVAEESFSVYDHPRVQVFKKTAAFDAEKVAAQLGDGIAWTSVIHLTPKQATAAPGGLMLSRADQVLYEEAAAGSSREVSPDSWGSNMPVFAWVLMLELLTILALPLILTAFNGLADRGFIFAKVGGLLLVGWGAWMLASIRTAPFTLTTISLVMVLLALGAILIVYKRSDELLAYVKAHWRLLAVEEVLFWLFFAAMLVIRMHNPDLWHPGMGGEKPMDLAFLTAVVRTPYFPAYDPWFAGGYINYYYFGFVLVAALIHLTGIEPAVAYNLAVPTLFAMTAMGAFGVALNLAAALRRATEPETPDAGARKHSEHSRTAFPPDGTESILSGAGRLFRPAESKDAALVTRQWTVSPGSLLAGLAGALFVTVIGNPSQVQLIFDGIKNLSALKPEDATLLTSLAQFFDGLGHWVGNRALPTINTNWWYWNATRVIPAAKGEAGPINEMPFFTFLFGDLHAHMMALPLTLLALGLALNLIRKPLPGGKTAAGAAWWWDGGEALTLALLALVTGALWPTNTWDFPTYTLLVGAALVFREVAGRGRIDWQGLWAAAWRFLLVVAAGRLLFLPFHRNYAGANFGVEFWTGSQTTLGPYLLIHGFFLFVLVSYLILDLMTGEGHNPLVLGLRYWLRSPLFGRGRSQAVAQDAPPSTPGYRLAVDMARLALVAVLALALIQPVIGLALCLAYLALLLMLRAKPDPARQFVLLLVLVGLLLTVAVEIVVLKGDISRMNTVFKFYLQVWVLWAVASAALLPELAAALAVRRSVPQRPRIDLPEGSAWSPEVAAQVEAARRRPAREVWQGRWWLTFGVLLAACLLYPLTATPAKANDRFQHSTAVTLDGSAYQRASVYFDDKRPVTLDYDRQAFDWLRQNAQDIAPVAEATTPLYRWGSRVSINTGLPTVIGWDWHEKQQRAVLPGQAIEHRIQDVKTIFTSTDVNEVQELLKEYGVKYIYVGPLERIYYAGSGLDKFDHPNDLWREVYHNEQVKIFEVKD